MAGTFGTARYLIQTVLDKTGAQQFQNVIKDINFAAATGVKGVTNAQKVLTRETQAMGTIGGTELRKLRIQYIDTAGALKTVDAIQRQVNGNWLSFRNTVGVTNGALGKLNQGLAGTTAGFLGAAKRALVVIPVWYALRSVITGLTTSFKEGIDHIIEFDTALARAKNLSGLSGQALSNFLADLTAKSRDLSRQTGVSIGKVVENFNILSDSGLSVEDSLAGMDVTLKTSIGLLADNEKSARLIADVYKLMGDTIPGATTATAKMQAIAGSMAVLWNENAFTLDEFIDSLKNFVPTARNYNLNLDQTLALTATAATLMSRGATSGTQMSRSFLELSTNVAKVEQILGRTVNLDTENSFSLLTEVLIKLNGQLAKGENIATKVIDVFGVRGSRTMQSFAANLEYLAKNLDKLSNADLAARVKDLTQKFLDQNNTIQSQINIFQELKKQSIEAFLQAITGADDYVEALKKINNFMNNTLIPSAIALGTFLKQPLANETDIGAIKKAFFETNNIKNPYAGLRDEANFAADFVNKNEQFKKFIADFASQDAVTKFKILTEQLKLTKEEAFKSLDVLDRYALNLNDFRAGVTFRGGKSQTTEQEQAKKDAEDALKNLEKQNKVEDEINATTKERLIMVDQLRTLGFNDLEIELKKLEVLKGHSKEYQTQLEKVQQLVVTEITGISKTLEDSISSAMSDVFQGNNSLADGFKKIGETIRKSISDAFAESLTDQIFNSTGIGQQFGEFVFGIKNAGLSIQGKIKQGHIDAMPQVYDTLVRGHVDGVTKAVSGSVNGGTSSLSGGTSGIGGLIGSILNFKIGASSKGAMTGINGEVLDANGNPISGFGGNLTKGGFLGSLGSGSGASLGQGLGAIGGAFALAQLAQSGGGGDVFGGALTGATSGFAIGGPIGAAIGGIAGALLGARAKTSTTTDQQTLQVASKIDVTNNKLDIINRNFVALKTNIETYILPDTAYFSVNRNLEDNFSINSRRGFA